MVGAIIGDLAAWTWEHDKNAFYKKLIMPEAVPSLLCEDVLLTANLLMRQKDMSYQAYSNHIKSISQTSTVLRAIAIGWLYNTEQETRSAYQKTITGHKSYPTRPERAMSSKPVLVAVNRTYDIPSWLS